MRETTKHVVMFASGAFTGLLLGMLGGYLYGRHEEEKLWKRLEREGSIVWPQMK